MATEKKFGKGEMIGNFIIEGMRERRAMGGGVISPCSSPAGTPPSSRFPRLFP